MASKRLLVTGAAGQLGTDLVRLLDKSFDITACDLTDFDITSEQQVLDGIKSRRPDIVIHAAAMTNVDACETNEDDAKRVNADGTFHVARACRQVGARLIYYSTDYVFDGAKATAYVETDRPNPRTVYGKSKLAGELFVSEELSDYAIVRIAWVYGSNGSNFLKTMLGLARKQAEIRHSGGVVSPLTVVDDQYGTPTCTEAIVRQTEEIITRDLTGVFHATSQDETTWYGFAREIFRLADLSVDIEPCTTEQFPRPAPRPRRSTLDNAALRQAGADIMPYWKESLERFMLDHKELL